MYTQAARKLRFTGAVTRAPDETLPTTFFALLSPPSVNMHFFATREEISQLWFFVGRGRYLGLAYETFFFIGSAMSWIY